MTQSPRESAVMTMAQRLANEVAALREEVARRMVLAGLYSRDGWTIAYQCDQDNRLRLDFPSRASRADEGYEVLFVPMRDRGDLPPELRPDLGARARIRIT